ncbi:MAG: htdY [Acidimicrobiales bacterium]|jgi:acyl dehydratase|nr:htdY [Acidimicrobiales bacterium]
MPIDPSAVGATFGPTTASWTSTDAIIYALGVGADELAFTTENSIGVAQQVLPTFPLVVGQVGRDRGARREPRPPTEPAGPGPMARIGTYDPAMVVHAGSSVSAPGPLPPAGSADISGRIAAIWDKGSGALVVLESEGRDPSDGRLLFTTTFSTFIRGEGGFSGNRGPSASASAPPERPPDHVVEYRTSPRQALLYRLSGDRNPLHSDPEFAARAGFDAPILHGLCTFGFTGRALLRAVCAAEPARFRSMEGRFSKPVTPGDVLRVSMWMDGDSALFRTENQRGDIAIDNGRCTFDA